MTYATSSIQPFVGIGPENRKPSWEWVGFDIGRELSKYYNVNFFPRKLTAPLLHDAVVLVKTKPPPVFLNNLLQPQTKLLYCPVDRYHSLQQLQADAEFLRRCQAIFVHCERLLPFFTPYCPIVEFVEHHNRFGLAQPVEYQERGYILWIGGLEHLHRTVQWLQEHPLNNEIKFVTDYPIAFKDRLRNVLPISDPHEIIKWSPRSQFEAMQGAKAAFDIKGLDFNQMHKPPVKAQQFIASGIPFATNPESYATEYFANKNLKLPSPTDKNYWLSPEYWEETQRFQISLHEQLTLETVGKTFQRTIDKILIN